MDDLTHALQAGLAAGGLAQPGPVALMPFAATAAFGLLRARDTDAAVDELLARCGSELDVDRIYVFEALPTAPGELVCSMHYEWARHGVSAELGNPDMQALPMHELMPGVSARLLAGEDVAAAVRELCPSEREVLEAQSIQSLMLAPVMLDDRVWGFIGVDAVRAERHWLPVEGQLLRLLGAMIGACVERRRSEAQLQLHARVFESTCDSVVITDAAGRIVAVNAAFSAITGYAADEVLGRTPAVLRSVEHDAAFFRTMWSDLKAKGAWQGEVWNRRRNGEVYPQRLAISAVLDPRGQPSHYVGVGTDISALKQSLNQLEHLAHHDALTQLPNRMHAARRLQRALQAAAKAGGRVAVIYLDLDGFKHINDSLGHAAGDSVLLEISQRLRRSTRSSDTLARLGGDEFLVVMEGLRSSDDAGAVADKLLRALEGPLLIEGQTFEISASAGISLFPEDGDDAERLIRNADSAMYQAKAAGHGQCSFYAPKINADALSRLEMDSWIKRGLAEDRFELHYQPKLDLLDNRVTAVEALVRLRSPDGELIPPDRFIPIAERTGRIVEIGAWVLREACAQLARWREAGFGGLKVAVNVSARQFRSRALREQILGALEAAGLPGSALELELTESVLMEDPEQAIERLQEFRRLGLGLALDDFGTGYSSLAYLIRLPIETLKIDRSFIRSLGDSGPSVDIVTSIIALAQRLRLQVVAEGVETSAQLERLRSYGCDQMQGYLLSRPLPAAELDAWLLRMWPQQGRQPVEPAASDHGRQAQDPPGG